VHLLQGDRYFLLDDCIQALRSALEAGQDDVLRFFLSQRNSVTTVCEAFEQSGLAATAETLNRSCNRAKLSQEEALLLGAALTQASNETWQKAGEFPGAQDMFSISGVAGCVQGATCERQV
jgi:hypothetical protein